MITYVLIALVGLVIALVGTTTETTWLVPVGLVILIGGFFWLVRSRQGTPIMTKEDGTER
ncbi:MAG: LPXTG cell wall anchor domain-containing protein [Actinomycetota bacterium]|nr:LPXTG cell wall anchor domain-containing protein [Actinomycetota bacterium]